MKERPILFSAPMVRAILDGRKTQTRRIVNEQHLRVTLPHAVSSDLPELIEPVITAKPATYVATMNMNGAVAINVKGQRLGVKPGEFDFCCPYATGGTHLGDYGDGRKWTIVPVKSRLWVRETIKRGPTLEDIRIEYRDTATYVADGASAMLDTWPWKRPLLPSIHCPRGLSRITLEVTGVRIERLQDISEEDAMAEGITKHLRQLRHGSTYEYGAPGEVCTNVYGDRSEGEPHYASSREAFAGLWESINGKRASWSSNPWVWVVEFHRVAPEASR